ncbi:DUF6894 family protein [Methylobacterium nigriterrae]|uniref:DUF6894 family protein n=1 Tax=Methylobacterium nigriterrae TaxID=3127512 RepID=UPI003013FE7C
MPWFYFDVLHDGDDVTRDHKGTELPDMGAARTYALVLWQRIIQERAAGGRDPTHWTIAILDVHGTVLDLLPHPARDEALG